MEEILLEIAKQTPLTGALIWVIIYLKKELEKERVYNKKLIEEDRERHQELIEGQKSQTDVNNKFIEYIKHGKK